MVQGQRKGVGAGVRDKGIWWGIGFWLSDATLPHSVHYIRWYCWSRMRDGGGATK